MDNKKRKPALPLEIQLGKIPPQAIDLEEAILSAVLKEKDAIEEIMDLFLPEVFYRDSSQLICEAILQLKQQHLPIDLLTVTQQLRSTGTLERAGGSYFVMEITNKVATAANIRYHMMLVYQSYLMRKIINNSLEAITAAYEDVTDVFDLIEGQKKFFSLLEDPILKMKQPSIAKQADITVRMMEEASYRTESTFGVPIGWREIDTTLSGLVPGDVIVVAARPGMGKTALAIAIANKLRRSNIPTDIYSLESKFYNVIIRMMAQDLKIPFSSLRKGNVDWLLVNQYIHELKKSCISIEDTTNLYAEELEARIRLRKRTHNIRVVILDYLQLLKMKSMGRSSNRENEVSEVSRMIKKVAMDTDTTIIPLSQLNRSVETRGGDFRPKLADLRESGSIEQDADEVIFIYRPEYYKIHYDATGRSTAGIAIVDIAKNRNGELREHALMFQGAYMSFDEFPVDHRFYVDESKAVKPGKKKTKQEIVIPEPARDFTEPQVSDDLPF